MINSAIQESIKTNSKHFKHYKRDIIDYETNNKQKNMLNKTIRKAKSN